MSQRIQGGRPGPGAIGLPEPAATPPKPAERGAGGAPPTDTFARAEPLGAFAALRSDGSPAPGSSSRAFDPQRLAGPFREAFDAGFARGAGRQVAAIFGGASGIPPGELAGVAEEVVSALPGALRGALTTAGIPPAEADAALAAAVRQVQSSAVAGTLSPAHEGLLDAISEGPAAFVGAAAELLGSRSEDVLRRIAEDPLGFVGDLLGAVEAGFERFAANVRDHLVGGLGEWLAGNLEDAGIDLPEELDVRGVAGVALQILGITGEAVFAKAERLLGDGATDVAREGWEALGQLSGEGPAAVWSQVKSLVGSGRETSAEKIGALLDRVVAPAAGKLLGLLDPASALTETIRTVYGLAGFVADQGGRVAGAGGAMAEEVGGFVEERVGNAADKLEGAMARTLPTVVGFLAEVLALGGISDRVRGTIGKVRATVDAALNRLVDRALELGGAAAAGLTRFLGGQEAAILGRLADGDPPAELLGAFEKVVSSQTRLAASGDEALAAFADVKGALVEALGHTDPAAALTALVDRRATDPGTPSGGRLRELASAEREALGRLLGAKDEVLGAVTTLLRQQQGSLEALLP